jgi:hypothetical protein
VPRDGRDAKKGDFKKGKKSKSDNLGLATDPMAAIQASEQANMGAAQVAKKVVEQEQIDERKQQEISSLPTDPLASISASIQGNESAAKTAADLQQ